MYVVVPVGSIVYWIVRNPATTLPPASVLSATLQTLWLAGVAAVVTTVLALPVALLTVRHPGRLSEVVERSSYLVRALPGIAIGLTFVTVAVQHFPAIYQSVLLLEAAYVVLSFPLALVAVRAALTAVPGVQSVTGEVCTVKGPAVAEAIAAEVCGRGWRLRHLAPVPDDLEAAFLAAVTGSTSAAS